MKKIALLGLVVLLSGCGRCWLPMFRGAPCQGTCGLPAMPASHETGCSGCAEGTTAGYGSYDGGVINEGIVGGEVFNDSGYYPGTVVENGAIGGYNGGIVSEGVINSPSMAPLGN